MTLTDLQRIMTTREASVWYKVHVLGLTVRQAAEAIGIGKSHTGRILLRAEMKVKTRLDTPEMQVWRTQFDGEKLIYHAPHKHWLETTNGVSRQFCDCGCGRWSDVHEAFIPSQLQQERDHPSKGNPFDDLVQRSDQMFLSQAMKEPVSPPVLNTKLDVEVRNGRVFSDFYQQWMSLNEFIAALKHGAICTNEPLFTKAA